MHYIKCKFSDGALNQKFTDIITIKLYLAFKGTVSQDPLPPYFSKSGYGCRDKHF